MSAQLVIAVLSAVVALLSIWLSARTSRSNTVLQARLNEEIVQRADRASKASQLEQVVSRYRDPLLTAAFDLQSRIYDIVERDFIRVYVGGDDARDEEYAVNSTLFVIAQFLGWVEALRRGVQFLDLGDVEDTRNLVGRLEAVRTTFASDTRFSRSLRVFRAEQRAIGELMLTASDGSQGDTTWHCQGYAAFCSRLREDQAFVSWFSRLDGDIRELAAGAVPGGSRLVSLQHVLLDLIDFLDDPPLRFPAHLRTRI